MIRVGILGYGGIARSHRRGYELLASRGEQVELVALCDIDPTQFKKDVTINQGGSDTGMAKAYHTYTDLEDMLANEKLDTVDICLPTYLHCEYACKLLKRGYNVQCEKPMGLNAEECDRMIAAANESGKKLMIGMCLRFDPYYLALKKMVDEKPFGKLRNIHFERLSGTPRWGYDGWFHDFKRSGGVALDMHIHDVDMVRFLFGEPKAIQAQVLDSDVRCLSVNTQFIFDDKLVDAIGDWGGSNTFTFRSTFRANFEQATVVMEGGKITVYPAEGEPYELEIEKKSHMAEEILYFSKVVTGEIRNEKMTLEDARETVLLVHKLLQNAQERGQWIEG